MDYNNLSKQPSNYYLGVVVNFKDQKEQVTGSGHGWRYKVAIMDSYSSTVDIKDSEIEYAIAILPCTAGSGGANRSQSVRISQGDVVILIKISGIPHIVGLYGRTSRIKYGTGRFDAKSGFVGKMQPKNLQGREEKGESIGNDVSTPLNTGSGSDKTKKRKTPSGIDGILAGALGPITGSGLGGVVSGAVSGLAGGGGIGGAVSGALGSVTGSGVLGEAVSGAVSGLAGGGGIGGAVSGAVGAVTGGGIDELISGESD